GIAPVTAAATGLVVNLALFLSATWHVHPYFLGSDSVYAVAWFAYLIAVVEARRSRAALHAVNRPRRQSRDAAVDIGRRQLMRGGVLAAATFVLAAASKGVAGSPTATSLRRVRSLPTGGAPTSSPATEPTVQGTPIASLDSVP